MVIVYTNYIITALILDGIIEQQEGVAGYTLNIPFVLVTIPTVLLRFYEVLRQPF